MMNLNLLNLFFIQIWTACEKSVDKVNKLISNINRYTINDKIRIDNFAFDNELTQIQAEVILNSLCDINIMKKTERMYRCPNCGVLLGILSIWDEGDDMECYNCGATHPYANECDTETIYSLYVAPTLKIFNVQWINDHDKELKANIIGYTQSDAESVVHEYYNYKEGSIKVSDGVELENKMLL